MEDAFFKTVFSHPRMIELLIVLVLEFQGRPERHVALRTIVYSGLAVQELIRHDKELARGDRDLAVACLVLYHGDRPWNAPTRLRYLFRDSAPDTHQVVSRRPPGRVSVLRQLAARKFGPAKV